MSRRVITDGRNPWQRDGRDGIARLRDQARWEHELRRVRVREAVIGWAIASGVGLAIVGLVVLVVLAINGKL